MRQKVQVLLLGLLILNVAASCTGFKHPIAQSKPENFDMKLIGAWILAANQNWPENIFLHIGEYEKSKTNSVAVIHSKDKERSQVESIKANTYTAKISDRRFIIVENREKLEDDEEAFYFFKYEFESSDILWIYPVDSCFLDSIVKNGILSGTVHPSNKVCWAKTVNSSEEDLVNFVNTHSDDELFPNKYRFERIALP